MTTRPAPATDDTFVPAETTEALASDVRASLTSHPRRLSPRHLYDPLGSALFDAICRLPWYRITRAEVRLLQRHANAILAAGSVTDVVELGPGNGQKLTALLSSASLERRTPVHLIDISPAALADASYKLAQMPNVDVTTHATTFIAGLESLRDNPAPGSRRLVLFLGSNIGNFEPPAANELLSEIRAAMTPGDVFLIGTDLVKSEADLLLAYDDPLGVTAAFSRNVLVRLNRELGANFDLAAFRHHAIWNAEASRVEIHLVSQREQRIEIPRADLGFTMAAGEAIWTESSYKYEPEGVKVLLTAAGFQPTAQWVDDRARFGLTLAGVG